ncbi:hypothetical protein [Acidaminobacter sp.]|uniref:hypothetical protein n=1 Tax=Acidaminobacter sp. TaxID=1872102 RepID=UPI0013811A22|nr:hypothetical protein [Acidaminobacter sp.]MDK9711104.1 hypothetical protein [Acidaminobacter sp.]MZQ97366.1 hypothetical protein [Acidaminobacter sp.]
MHEGFNRIFWGLCFVTFHINLGGFEGLPLPAFAAYLMVRSGIKQLINEPPPTEVEEAHPKPIIEETSTDTVHPPTHYFKRAATLALISALVAVPRVATAFYSQLLAQHPLAMLLNFGLGALLDLALAYCLLTGAACLLEIQGNPERKVFYLKRLRLYLVLLVSASIIGIAGLALGMLESSVAYGIAMLALRIWFILLVYGLKPASDSRPSQAPSAP